MITPPALAGLRVGCVSYLNAKPLVWALDQAQIKFEIPSLLANDFAAGKLDIALLPVFAILTLGGGLVANDVAIACRGAVHSVFVASRRDFAETSDVYLDPASRSSAALLRVLAAEFYPGRVAIREADVVPEEAARLIIGDPALAFRRDHTEGWQFHDLGELWLKHTSLPFVFAAWAIRAGVENASVVGESLRVVKSLGLLERAEIAAREEFPDEALAYLTDSIRYDIGPAEKEAVRLFSKLAHRHGFLPSEAQLEYR